MLFKQLKSFLRDYFTLTSRERKGALMLAGIIIFQLLAIIRFHYISPPRAPEITVYRFQVEAFESRMAVRDSVDGITRRNVAEKKIVPILYPFDPNTINDEQWIEMGLSEKQTSVIRNYLGKGGRFRDKEGLSKMYCISPEQFRRMEPYIAITATKKSNDSTGNHVRRVKNQPQTLELNSADTLQLLGLPLIGPGRARMIFRYRERLGGFYSVKQLLEVYTIDSSVIIAIEPYIRIDTANIRKMNFNSDTLYHPYLNKNITRALVAYRKQHGNFSHINDLRKVAMTDEQLWVKVAPYVAFE